MTSDEAVEELIEDSWKVLTCEPNPAGCTVEFDDPDFSRDTVYYVRAKQVGGIYDQEEDIYRDIWAWSSSPWPTRLPMRGFGSHWASWALLARPAYTNT